MAGGIVIVGAGLAGHAAASALRAAGYDGALTLIGRENRPAYDRPPLSKAAIMDEAEPQPSWLAQSGPLQADHRQGVSVVGIDRSAKTVQLFDGGAHPYDKLLLALGAKPRPLTVPGGERALLLRNFEDAVALRACFQPGRRIVIIGGGFIGLELAASAVKRGCRVTVIEAQPRLLTRGVPESIARIIHDRHLAAGVEIRTGITVDATLRTGDPDIFAAGDCCSFPHPLFGGECIRLEAWRNAQDQGAFVARAMLGAEAAYAAIPSFWSDQYDLSMQIAGLPGLGTSTVTRQATETTQLLFHLAGGGRLVGASGIGPGNAVARDIKLAEMLIARAARPDPQALVAPAVSLKALLKA
jgi:3-phenylpropionate/trans-cinnamate dioxygenase ferredoxin reductase subunit